MTLFLTNQMPHAVTFDQSEGLTNLYPPQNCDQHEELSEECDTWDNRVVIVAAGANKDAILSPGLSDPALTTVWSHYLWQ